MGTSADLLFRISTDSAPAQADLAALKDAVTNVCGEAAAAGASAGSSLGDSLGGMHKGFHRVGESTRETREALRGLGEEIGVAMPRFVSSWLASLGGVSTVMAAAFAPIAIVGMIEVLGKIPGALQKGIDWLHGWTAEVKKAFETNLHDSLEFQERTIRLNERMRAVALIGQEGMKKWGLEATINSKNIKEVADKVDDLNKELEKNKAIVAEQNAPPPGPVMFGQPLPPRTPAHSAAEVERAQKSIEPLKEAIKLVQAQLDDLSIKSKEIPAEAAAAAAAAAKDLAAKTEEIERRSEEFAQTSLQWVIKEMKEKAKAEEQAFKDRSYFEDENLRRSDTWLRELMEVFKKQREEAAAAAKDIGELQQRLREELGKSLEEEHRALDEKINLEEAARDKTDKDYQQAMALEEQIRAAGHAKIDADNAAAYAQELARLDEHLKQIERRDETSKERILSAYKADVEKTIAAEQEETVKFAGDKAQQAEIATRYAGIRAALYDKEQKELQTLANSQGWKAVFGAGMAEGLQRNEELMKQWAQSGHGFALTMQASLEGLKETAQDAFMSMAQGMAGSIISAEIHKKSIKEAMKEEEKAFLESLANTAALHVIKDTAKGFEDIAEGDAGGAAAAFAAAALWGSVGVAATVAGRSINTGAGGAGAASGAGGGSGSDRATNGADTGAGVGRTAAGQGGPHVTVNVQGHLVGWTNIGELTGAISDAVLNSGASLTATNTSTGVQVVK
jgi:hypothetical protein